MDKQPQSPLVINIIPPEENGKSLKTILNPLNLFFSGSSANTSPIKIVDGQPEQILTKSSQYENQNIHSTSVFTTYYRHKAFKLLHFLMCMLGWRPFYAKSVIIYHPNILIRTINLIYPAIVFLILVLSLPEAYNCNTNLWQPYMQVQSPVCWKYESKNGFSQPPVSNEIWGILRLAFTQNKFVLLDLLTILLYIYCFYLLRYKDWELIHTLIETTFLKLNPSLVAEEALHPENLLSDSLHSSEGSGSTKSSPTHTSTAMKHRISLGQTKKRNGYRKKLCWKYFSQLFMFVMVWLTILMFGLTIRFLNILVNGVADGFWSQVLQISVNSTILYQHIMLATVFFIYLILLHCLQFLLCETKEGILNKSIDLDAAKKEIIKIKHWVDNLNEKFGLPIGILFTIFFTRLWQMSVNLPKTQAKNMDIKLLTNVDTYLVETIWVIALLIVISGYLMISPLLYIFHKASKLAKVLTLNEFYGQEIGSKPYGIMNIPNNLIDSFLIYLQQFKMVILVYGQPISIVQHFFNFLILYIIYSKLFKE